MEQKELAKLTGVSVESIRRFEAGTGVLNARAPIIVALLNTFKAEGIEIPFGGDYDPGITFCRTPPPNVRVRQKSPRKGTG